MDLFDGAVWHCVATPPGAVLSPDQLPDQLGSRLVAEVPGTAAGAIRTAHGATAAREAHTDASDWWFVTQVQRSGTGPWRLELDGLATLAEVWVGDERVAVSESMFVPLVVELDSIPENFCFALRFASLDAAVAKRRPRGRWRSSMIRAQGLRWIRTTMLGRAPVFSGVPAPVGPWRRVALVDASAPRLVDRRIRVTVDGDSGVVDLDVTLSGVAVGDSVTARVGSAVASATIEDGRVRARVEVPDVRRWWPHTHGEPALYPVSLEVGGDRVDVGAVGFRDLTVDRSDGGFRLSINGIGVFCRGLVWTPADPVALTSPEQTGRMLERCIDAGVNLIRIPGTMVYEDDAFWSACAESGILVWQDVMLATTDPPETEEFRALLVDEVRGVLRSVSGNPALAVVCGGSETEQQPTMLGLGRPPIAALDEWLPAVVAAEAPAAVWVSSSPSAPPGSRVLPTHVGSGIAHYFGVGGYRRPLTDVRSAGVRFAAECLAFSIPPGNDAIEADFGTVAVAGHHPRWKTAVPRDHGASWDFEDVRDHYVRTVFEQDPATVRWSDPERYLDLGRAAVCEAFAATLAFWRRPDSRCHGALILAARDLEPGAGWGVLEHSGVPKAPWFVLRRIWAPVAVLLGDDGIDGLRIDAFNDTAVAVEARLELLVHTRSGVVAHEETLSVELAAHSASTWSFDELLGRFTDVTHTYRFGPQTYESATARLVAADGSVLSEDVYLVGEAVRPYERSIGLSATAIESESGEWSLEVATDGAAQYVSLELRGFEPADSWFHLPPGGRRTVALQRTGEARTVSGRVRALNSAATAAVSTG
ncbi:glycosyl hydrolase [Rhodococcus sp. NPDC003382]